MLKGISYFFDPYSFFFLVLILINASIYDLFNKRSLPTQHIVVYIFVSFFYSLIFSKFFLDSIFQSFFIMLIGYFMYKKGFIGLADPILFSSLSFLVPYYEIYDYKIPFALIAFFFSGIFFVVFSIFYYSYKIFAEIKKLEETKYFSININYYSLSPLIIMLFFLILNSFYQTFSLLAISIIFIFSFSAFFFTAFEKPIKYLSITKEKVSYNLLEEIIAFDFLDEKTKKIIGENRVIDDLMIKKLKKAKIKKIPVYTNLLPFLPFLLAGTLFSLIFDISYFFG